MEDFALMDMYNQDATVINAYMRHAGASIYSGQLVRISGNSKDSVVLSVRGNLACVYHSLADTYWFRWDGEKWTSRNKELLSVEEDV